MAQYARTAEREKVLDRYPEYAVEIAEAGGRFVAEIDGAIIAETERALEVRESFHEAVIYFPPEAARPGLLQPSTHQTRCPFKGDASYFSILTEDVRLDNAVWVYEDPMEEVAALAGHLAFYTDRVRVRRLD
ncbi:MAG: DUF427 domain-containing protein [Pseudomonadales bacterium]|jgi:uncharacterized protein (DUF427 family)|nr:DUF427 domain-containing protein [Pseudomonadales bacterium]